MIVVDGYNLIGQEAGALSGLSLEKEREKLLRRLEQLSAVSGEQFLVVFDASFQPAASLLTAKSRSPKSAVLVAFSKSGESADTWVVKYFSRQPGKSAVLITRDRELTKKVRKMGFKVETDLSRSESHSEPYIFQPITPSQAGGDLLSSLSRQSREALAQVRKKAKKS